MRHIIPNTIQPTLPNNKNQMFNGNIFKLVKTTPASNIIVQVHSNQNKKLLLFNISVSTDIHNSL